MDSPQKKTLAEQLAEVCARKKARLAEKAGLASPSEDLCVKCHRPCKRGMHFRQIPGTIGLEGPHCWNCCSLSQDSPVTRDERPEPEFSPKRKGPK